MAVLTDSFQTIWSGTWGSGDPNLAVTCQARQSGGSGTSRTIVVRGGFKVNKPTSASWWGYPCSWQPYIYANGSNYFGTTTQFKGGEGWSGGQDYRYFEQTITIDVGTSSAADIRIYIATADGGYGWGGSASGACTVSATNTRPTWPSGAVLNITSPAAYNSYIPENTSTIQLSSNMLANDDGGQGNLTYKFYYSIGSGWVFMGNGVVSGGVALFTVGSSLINSIKASSSYVTFYIDAADSGGMAAGVQSPTVRFNQLTGASLSSTGSIGYYATEFYVTVSGASNNNGNTSFNYYLSCSGIPVYNAGAISNGTNTIYINDSGVSGKPYIKKSEMLAYLKEQGYRGNLMLTVTTSNAYGSSATSGTLSKWADVRFNPPAPTGLSVSNSSTARKLVLGSYYYIPDSSNSITVTWNTISGLLPGISATYTLYYSFGSGDVLIASDIYSSSNTYTFSCPKQTSQRTLTIKIKTVDSFGYESGVTSTNIAIQYYNPPSLTFDGVVRTQTQADVKYNLNSSTSISAIKPTIVSVSKGTFTATNITVTGLNDDSSGTVNVVYGDNSGLISNLTTSFSYSKNLPVFHIGANGIGVGGVEATSFYALNVKGSARVDGRLDINNLCLGNSYDSGNSAYSWDLGTLIKTNIPKTSNTMTELLITGNGYGTGFPIDSKVQCYTYNQTIINHACLNNGLELNVYAMFLDDVLCFWLVQPSQFITLRFVLKTSTGQMSPLYTLSNVVKPTTATNMTAIKNVNSYSTSRKPSPNEIGAMYTVPGESNYPVMVDSNGSASNWMCTSSQGLIPYRSGGSSSALGTSGWRFSSIYGTVIDASSNIICGGNNIAGGSSNTNGVYVRFYDGTQICWNRETYANNLDMTNNIVNNTVYGGRSYGITFPAAFKSGTYPAVTMGCESSIFMCTNAYSTSNSNAILRFWSNYPTNTTVVLEYVAVGRWY